MKFGMPEFIKNLDMFGAPVPTFNTGGKKTVNTSCGAIVSLLITVLSLLYAGLKLGHLAERKNPLITTNVTPLEAGERFNTGDEDFRMAFAVTDWGRNYSKSDPRYVQWRVAVVSHEGERIEVEQLLLHPCSDAELAEFYPPKNQAVAIEVNALQAGSHLFCLDWQKHGLEVYGDWRTGSNFSSVQVSLVPCGSVQGQDDCEYDQ